MATEITGVQLVVYPGVIGCLGSMTRPVSTWSALLYFIYNTKYNEFSSQFKNKIQNNNLNNMKVEDAMLQDPKDAFIVSRIVQIYCTTNFTIDACLGNDLSINGLTNQIKNALRSNIDNDQEKYSKWIMINSIIQYLIVIMMIMICSIIIQY